MSDDVKYEGWDLVELAYRFGLEGAVRRDEYFSWIDDDEDLVLALEAHVRQSLSATGEASGLQAKTAASLREHCVLMAASIGCGDYGPVWRAIADTESDFVVCQLSLPLLAHMWT